MDVLVGSMMALGWVELCPSCRLPAGSPPGTIRSGDKFIVPKTANPVPGTEIPVPGTKKLHCEDENSRSRDLNSLSCD